MFLNFWEEKNEEYTIKSRDFLTSRNVAMDVTNRSPPDATLTHTQIVLKIILLNNKGLRWS